MSSILKNDRFLRALRREAVDRTPVWIMRQAGRYLPEYRATRAKAGSFMTLCQTPELACEVTLQPLRRFELDASIIFSDILTIPDAMGLGLSFVEGEGPRFARPIQTENDIKRLAVPDLAKLDYVYQAIKLVQHELAGKIPLIGFCGSPWTLATYMIDGNSKGGFPQTVKMLNESPQLMHQLLAILATSVSAHLAAQIDAGVQAVMIFDTWGGMLSTPQYMAFSLAYMQSIITSLNASHPNTPVILFTKGGNEWLEAMAATGCQGIGVDWEITLQEARQRVGAKVALQGNLHPGTLLQAPDVIRAEAAKVLASYGSGNGHIFNLGHGITPDVPPDHVHVLVEAVHSVSAQYHESK